MQKYEKELIWQEKTFYVGSILLFLTPGCIVFSVVLGAKVERTNSEGRLEAGDTLLRCPLRYVLF